MSADMLPYARLAPHQLDPEATRKFYAASADRLKLALALVAAGVPAARSAEIVRRIAAGEKAAVQN